MFYLYVYAISMYVAAQLWFCDYHVSFLMGGWPFRNNLSRRDINKTKSISSVKSCYLLSTTYWLGPDILASSVKESEGWSLKHHKSQVLT